MGGVIYKERSSQRLIQIQRWPLKTKQKKTKQSPQKASYKKKIVSDILDREWKNQLRRKWMKNQLFIIFFYFVYYYLTFLFSNQTFFDR